MNKYGGCLVTGTGPNGVLGERYGCEGSTNVGTSVAVCGLGAVACYIRKGGTIYKICWNNPASTACA